MLFHFGRTRDVYVATRIILSSTAEGSATNGYEAAMERFGQCEAWAGRNVERARKYVYGNNFDLLFMSLFIVSARE